MMKVAELLGHTERVLNTALSPDGSTLVSAGADETLRLVISKVALKVVVVHISLCIQGMQKTTFIINMMYSSFPSC